MPRRQRSEHLTFVRDLLRDLGENPKREGLEDTPARFLDAMREFTIGYSARPKSVLKAFADGAEGVGVDHGMVVQCNIALWSLCEHHLLPFFGWAHVGYIPDGKIVGLSKLTRLVDLFARRLQVQERLGRQVVDALCEVVKPKGAAIVLTCRHTCMESRGVKVHGTETTTSALRGVLLEAPAARAEFMSIVASRTKGL